MRRTGVRKKDVKQHAMKSVAWVSAHLSRGRPGDAERKISVIRLLILFALLPLLWWDVVSPQTKIVLIWLTALIAAYILAALFVFPRVRMVLRHDLFLTIDIIAITTLVWFTGGIGSNLLFLLYLPILAAAIRFDLREAVLSAIAVSGIVVWMWSLEEGGLPSLGSTTMRVGLFAGTSVVLAIFFSLLARETRLLHERAVRNRALNERLNETNDQVLRRVGELEFAYDLSRQLADTTEIVPALVAVGDAARRLLQAPYSAVFLSSNADGELAPAYAAGLSESEARPIMEACGRKLAKDKADPITVAADGKGPWIRAVCAPLLVEGRLLGALCVGGDDGWQAARHSAAVLGHVASQAAIALDRAFLAEDMQRLATAKPQARLYAEEQFERFLRDEVNRATQLGVPLTLIHLRAPEHPPAAPVRMRLAEVALGAVRRIDVVAQAEHGELFILLSMTDLGGAEKFTKRLLHRLREDESLSQLLNGQSPSGFRVGIAAFPDDAVAAAELSFAAKNAVESADGGKTIVRAADLEVDQAKT